MKISLNWLSDYLPGTLDAKELATTLTNGGLPVEVIERVGDDTMIDVEVTSNRSDCLSHIGVAREIAALQRREFTVPAPSPKVAAAPASSATSVDIDPAARALCPIYTARILRNVRIQPSPDWMQQRLETVGLRPVNNVVDVTNYVMFEMGQPLHAFDFDRLKGRKVVVRLARRGEKLTSLDGRERALNEDMLVIADAERAVAIAGVMGGVDSEVGGATTNLLLESAIFDPLSVRRTSRTLALKSDSSYRFERGIDPTLPQRASLRAAELILQTAGGELLDGLVLASSLKVPTKKLSVRLRQMTRLLGIELPADEVIVAFRRLELSPSLNGDRIDVVVPSHRLDINIETDLIEEAARTLGYDRIPIRDTIEIRLTPLDLRRASIDRIRANLVAGGYFEAVTVTFLPDALVNDFTPSGATGLARVDAMTRKSDAHLRPSVIPSLLEALRHNEAHGVGGAKLFEIAQVFWLDAGQKVAETQRLAAVGSEDHHEVRGQLESLLTTLDAARPIRFVPAEHAGYARGMCARVEWGDVPIGHFGQVDKSSCDKLDIRSRPCAFEVDVHPLIETTQHVPQLRPLPRFPGVERDLSLVVSDSVRYAQIESLLNGLNLENLESLAYVTTYRGKPLDKGTKSVTVKLLFRSPDTTLTSDAVEAAVQRAIDAAKQSLKATLRT
jgi:phenylalanyl-tRNA synthetase beta chain